MAQVKDFGIGPDETMVRDTARSFLAEHTPVDKLRKSFQPVRRQRFVAENIVDDEFRHRRRNQTQQRRNGDGGECEHYRGALGPHQSPE